MRSGSKLSLVVALVFAFNVVVAQHKDSVQLFDSFQKFEVVKDSIETILFNKEFFMIDTCSRDKSHANPTFILQNKMVIGKGFILKT